MSLGWGSCTIGANAILSGIYNYIYIYYIISYALYIIYKYNIYISIYYIYNLFNKTFTSFSQGPWSIAVARPPILPEALTARDAPLRQCSRQPGLLPKARTHAAGLEFPWLGHMERIATQYLTFGCHRPTFWANFIKFPQPTCESTFRASMAKHDTDFLRNMYSYIRNMYHIWLSHAESRIQNLAVKSSQLSDMFFHDFLTMGLS